MAMRIALWKGTDPGFAGILDRAVKWWTNGPYSHCEVIFSDGWTGTASWADKGVALVQRPEGYYDPKDWDFIELEGDELAVRSWYRLHRGLPYDLLGDFGFVWRPIRGLGGSYFCSEAFGSSFQWPDSWQFNPNQVACILRIPKYVPAG